MSGTSISPKCSARGARSARRVVRRALLSLLVASATFVAAAPAQAYTYFLLRYGDSGQVLYVAHSVHPSTPPNLVLANLTGPNGGVSVYAQWSFQSAGTQGFRGPTLLRIVNRGSHKCMTPQAGSSFQDIHPVLGYPCSTANRDQLWTVWSGGQPLRGAGNLPSEGSYALRSAGSWHDFLVVPRKTAPHAAGELLSLFGTSPSSQQFSIRPLGGT